MADAATWEADSMRDDQGDAWDRDAWTDEVRPGESVADPEADFDRPAEHVPQLHRAMSEAAADLEAVDDRLSTLFDRAEGTGPDTATGPRSAPARRSPVHPEFAADDAGVTGDDDGADDGVDGDDFFDLFADGVVEQADEDDIGFARPAAPATVVDRRAIIGEYEDDIGGDFAALDAELAAEEPDGPAEPKRRMFGRRAKGTAAAGR
jgi:hypothetical protein